MPTQQSERCPTCGQPIPLIPTPRLPAPAALDWQDDTDDPRQVELITPEEREALAAFIRTSYEPAESVYRQNSSYTLKHYFEQSPNGCYVVNGAFKGAMLAAGFKAANPPEANWFFYLRLRPPGLCRAVDNRGVRCRRPATLSSSYCRPHQQRFREAGSG